MYDYIKKLIDSLLVQEDMKEFKHTTPPGYLFWSDDDNAIKLSTEMSDLFHNITAQTLWVAR